MNTADVLKLLKLKYGSFVIVLETGEVRRVLNTQQKESNIIIRTAPFKLTGAVEYTYDFNYDEVMVYE